MRNLALGLWLVAVWIALWEDVSAANLVSGALVAAALLSFSRRRRAEPVGAFRPIAAVRFAAWFFYKLVEASVILAWEVVTPRNRINEGIVAVPLAPVSDALVTIVANAISLTPGTVTLDARRDPTTLYVHVLHLRDIDAVRREVWQLQRLAVAAFGTAAANDAVREFSERTGVPDATIEASQATTAVREEDRR